MFAARLRALPSLRYLSADLASPRAMLRADVQRLPLPDACFDSILCHHVLEHVPDDRAAMGELRRVLRPGGWAILQSPIARSSRSPSKTRRSSIPASASAASGRATTCASTDATTRARLREAGFEVRAERFIQTLPPERRAAHGLKGETIWLCLRPAS